ncbi:MAG: TRAP transporter small permease subunit [Alphaproteobacteria bacterium]
MKVLRFIEWLFSYINRIFGFIASVAMIAFIFIVFFIAISREFFTFTSSKLDDSAIILFAIIFTFASGYTLLHHGHVRIDIFYAKFSPKFRALVNIFGSIFLGLPAMTFLLVKAIPKAQHAFALKLTSQYSDGISFYWALKYFIIIAAFLLILQIVALIIRSFLVLLGEPEVGTSFDKPVVGALHDEEGF